MNENGFFASLSQLVANIIYFAERPAECGLHDLRHTFATERVGLMALEELRALMGHENIQTTLRYQKVTSLRAEEVAHKALNVLTNSENKSK
jgi:site-specific recombinase XerD